MTRLALTLLAIASPLVLAGCLARDDAFLPTDGIQPVALRSEAILGKRTAWVQNRQQAAAVDAQVRQLLNAKYVGADAAVQIALLNNKGLQAAYADIGISVADLWQESLPPLNPTISLRYGTVDFTRTVEGLVVTNIVALLTRERRLAVAERNVNAAQLQAVLATLEVASQTRRAWIEAVAAWERVSYLARAKVAADAAAELATELNRTGSMPKADQAREQVFYAELTADVAEARMEARLAKERLVRVMGLYGRGIDFEVPNALPRLPRSVQNRSGIEGEALRNRVDLQIARLQLETLARSYGLTKATRFVSDLELGAGVEIEEEIEEEEGEEGEEPKEVRKTNLSPTFEVGFTIPIFDSGQARLRKAEFEYLRSANLLAERAVNVRSEARSAYQAYRSSYDIARHWQNSVLPLQRTLEEQAVLTYNGMITSTFELITDTRERIEANVSAVEARRAFWLADEALSSTVFGGGEGGGIEVETAEAGGDED
ncbi:TolC family protein [Antarcticirhabdus aurantiaca]|uniref:TolC family protein n=1 Tax=Antarcticirhabdus aurantiaca TaxID=2606717 RepID=A0ACD4NWN1_9HYPH|nr:TolC family protein [Antarcticirhabdus aurantiaca]WAJ31236.1 TolC family protein [Jeongeuplla avenae]